MQDEHKTMKPESTMRLIVVKDFGRKGRGVVATRDIPADTTIERVPVIVIPMKDRPLIEKTVIDSYYFVYERCKTKEEKEHWHKGNGRAAIALGLTNLVNHSNNPNADIVQHIEEQEIELRSVRDILVGEEVTIDYAVELWFDLE